MSTTEEQIYHLNYIRERHFATWEELICLSKAIGFPDHALVNDCQKYCKCKEDGVNYEDLKEMVKNNEYQESIGYTYNNHSFDWNGGLITMGFRSVSHKFITFGELRRIRLAFTLYEEEDGHGLLCDSNVILKTLKTCGRIISPMMLQYRLYHVASILRVKNRLQIAEFLEIVIWCQLYTDCESKIKFYSVTNDKTKRNLYQLRDFMDFLKRKDAHIHEMLDQKFLVDYWSLLQEKHSNKKSFQEHPILSYIRVAQTTKNKALYAPTKEALDESQFAHRLGRPQSAAVILQKIKEGQKRIKPPKKHLTLDEKFREAFKNGKSLTANQMLNPYMKETYPQVSKEAQTEVSQTHISSIRPKTAPCVTQQERDLMIEKTVALKFDMDMLPRRYEDYVVNDLEFIRPGFWTRKAKRTIPVPDPPPPPKPKPEKRPTDDFLKRISSPPLRQPSPCHSRVCNRFNNSTHDTDTVHRQFKAREIKIRVLSGDKSTRLFQRFKQSKESVKCPTETIVSDKEDENPLYTLLNKTLNGRKTPLLVVSGSESFDLRKSCCI